ncbi:ATP synthase F1 subunit epsilon [Bacteroidia bacterium]|jgi:F-type H+-transporting ATPase subunit epsilon|nr:ATP synthase F1 subunit epsilon [Bacteroidia bacterium]MDC0560646.1 ATP synthase F1 subunit epsilon [Bacteroidia bacterium]MDC3406512.1 ATP synthase F1 subunit epsilon [Bacteroidia bacterium]
MIVEVITPDEVLFSGEAISVKLPGTSGSFEALSNHAPLLSSLEKGSIVVRTAGGEEIFEVSGGIVEVLNNKVVVLA